jgi:hypothetical protein
MERRMTKTIGTAAGFLSAILFAACYNTNNVVNGGLQCGPASACPDGFVCKADGHCWKTGSGPDSGVPVGSACTLANAKPPLGPFAACGPNKLVATSTCDPVCQEGCPCDRRCVIETTTYGSFVCESSAPPSTFVPPLGTCDGNNFGACAPGSQCIGDDFCPNLCYKTCTKDSDCPTNSRCSVITMLDVNRRPLPDVYLCTPPVEGCNPMGSAACATARANFSCVFLAGLTGVGNTDATVCDCSTLHDKKVGGDCSTLPDDCVPGAVCVDGKCRQVCDRKVATACSGGASCSAVYGSTVYGYCH